MARHVSYPEGAVGHIDLPPGYNDGVFNGLNRSVGTHERAVSPVSDLDVEGAALSVLGRHKTIEVSSAVCCLMQYK